MKTICNALPEQKIIIIAGPNGAGKTTFAGEFLPREAQCPFFINADLIAAGLAPYDPDRMAFRAGRLMLEQIQRHVRHRENFAFETTLSGRIYAGLIPRWQAKGYQVKLFFLRLVSPELALARVRQRVREGGHNIPEAIVRRRFASELNNFTSIYKNLVNEWALYDNSGSEPILIQEGMKLGADKWIIVARQIESVILIWQQLKLPCDEPQKRRGKEPDKQEMALLFGKMGKLSLNK